MDITAGVTIERGDTVTRQTIFNLWANGTLGQVAENDLLPGVLPILAGSTETVGINPGAILYDQTELLYKCYYDQVDDTGVSLWLAWGPDRFDEAFIAAEPIPAGAAVKISSVGDRWVERVSGYNDGHVVAFNQKQETAASGTWFAGAIEGICRAWFPFKPAGNTETGSEGAVQNIVCVPISWAPGGIGQQTGAGNLAKDAWIYGTPLINVVCDTTASHGGHPRQLIVFNGPRYTRPE